MNNIDLCLSRKNFTNSIGKMFYDLNGLKYIVKQATDSYLLLNIVAKNSNYEVKDSSEREVLETTLMTIKEYNDFKEFLTKYKHIPVIACRAEKAQSKNNVDNSLKKRKVPFSSGYDYSVEDLIQEYQHEVSDSAFDNAYDNSDDISDIMEYYSDHINDN